MKNIFKSIQLCSILLLTSMCNDILEQDISNDSILLRTPPDLFSSTETKVNFWWDKLDGAENYHITIASPDFQNPLLLVADSVIVGNKISLNLQIGKYEWCVSGQNPAYSTLTSCRTLEIIN